MIRHITLSLIFLSPVAAFALTDASAPTPAPAEEKRLFQLSYDDVEAAIAQALVDKGVAEKISASVVGRKGDSLFSYDRPISVEIRSLTYDKPTRRWSASLLAVSGEEVLTAKPVAGRFEEVVEVPVLKRQVRSGEVITEGDVEMQKIALSRTRSGTISDKAALVGLTPERSISANRPVREQEIAHPALVKKNAIVRMRYFMPGMEISTTGQVLEDGVKGHMVSVRNLASKKVVHAVVESENTVSITPAEQPTEAQAISAEGHYATN